MKHFYGLLGIIIGIFAAYQAIMHPQIKGGVAFVVFIIGAGLVNSGFNIGTSGNFQVEDTDDGE